MPDSSLPEESLLLSDTALYALGGLAVLFAGFGFLVVVYSILVVQQVLLGLLMVAFLVLAYVIAAGLVLFLRAYVRRTRTVAAEA